MFVNNNDSNGSNAWLDAYKFYRNNAPSRRYIFQRNRVYIYK